ncbi:MAG: pyruvate dehydrogenase [Flavobacterium sp.]|nr:pyruvate dehydrogenase [Flavobacterium sp.]
MNSLFKASQELIIKALTIRFTENKLLELFSLGKLFGTIHTCIGQELTGVAVSACLNENDFVFSNHRCHGHYLSYCDDVEGLIAEIMGKSNGVCGGIGGSQHLQKYNFFSNGIQGGIIPVAAGLAFSLKLQNKNAVSVVFIGDGTLGEGLFYETMNLASKWELPLLIVLENNLYAQSTHQNETIAGSILDRPKSFGIESYENNTWEWEKLFSDIHTSVENIRKKCKPVFHLINTYRLMAHSKGDDNRSSAEIVKFQSIDPINLLLEECKNNNLYKDIIQGIQDRIETSVLKAESASKLEIKFPENIKKCESWFPFHFSEGKIVNLINHALANSLSENSKVVLLGEDIKSPYGGAFKVTEGLSEKYPGRILNTPISEAAIMGIANGLALGGFIPIVEIMFGDFLSLVFDQWLNHAAKFRMMYNNKVKTPVILRTAVGGKRGYGPTHSQCPEKHFIGIPDTVILSLHTRYSPLDVYLDLISTIDSPTLVLENKILYSRNASSNVMPGYKLLRNSDKFPLVWLKPDSQADITILVTGGIGIEVEGILESIYEEHEILVEIIYVTQLYPFNINSLDGIITRSKRLLIVEEGQGFVSFGSEIIAQVSENYYSTHVKCGRVNAKPFVIPVSRPLENLCLPNQDEITKKILELINE